jgi:hypothetical protein
MGTLANYSIRGVPCDVFVETGTGAGASLMHAIFSKQFEKIFSVEIHEPSAKRAREKFKRFKNVEIQNTDSASALRDILNQVKAYDRVFFFLDAHFPGEFSKQFGGYDQVVPDQIALPLESELRLIHQLRPDRQDVIVVDDLRLYEDGPFEHGNLPSGFANIPPEFRNLDFVESIFPERTIRRDYRDEGYLFILAPGVSFSFGELSFAERLHKRFRRFML